MKKLLRIFTLLSFLLGISFSASFDCSKAKLETEKIICEFPSLSKLDEDMAKAYKYMLSISNETQKQELINEQRKWLKYRNSIKIDENIRWQHITILYESRLFNLRENGFHLTYAKDNSTCNAFLDILKNDLKNNGDINISRIDEFNWADWKIIQDRPSYYIYMTYFDINNDKIDEAVFKYQFVYKIWEQVNMIYTLKEYGPFVENYSENRTDYSKLSTITQEKQLNQNTDEINNGFGVYNDNEFIESILHNKTIDRNVSSSMMDPEPYPFKLDNTYYIAIFGIKESSLLQYVPSYSMLNNGNRINLIKYNNENKIDTICIIDRINSNTKKYLRYLK